MAFGSDAASRASGSPAAPPITAELRTPPVNRVCQDHSQRNPVLFCLPNLFQGNLRLGLKCNSFWYAGLLAALEILAPNFRQI
jgi:hypothetical protein